MISSFCVRGVAVMSLIDGHLFICSLFVCYIMCWGRSVPMIFKALVKMC